jgi:GMC oxidoreductase
VCCCWKPARLAVPQGRVIGSAVDAAVAMRPRPADFARWAKRGIEGWSWDEARAPLAGPAMSPQRGRKQRQPWAPTRLTRASNLRRGTAPMVNGPVVRLFWRALDGLDYWVMQGRLWLVQAVCDPEP